MSRDYKAYDRGGEFVEIESPSGLTYTDVPRDGDNFYIGFVAILTKEGRRAFRSILDQDSEWKKSAIIALAYKLWMDKGIAPLPGYIGLKSAEFDTAMKLVNHLYPLSQK